MKTDSPPLIKRRKLLLTELRQLNDPVVGSFFEREIRGTRRFCLSRMRGKTQRQVYISAVHSEAVRRGVLQYRRTLALLTELGEVNLGLIQQGEELHND